MCRTAPRGRLVVLSLLATLAAGCSTTNEPPVSVAGPSLADGYVAVTETFNGTLAFGGSSLHTFHTMPGLVTVTLVSTDPADAPAFAMGIGMWDGLTCQPVLESYGAVASTVLVGTASMDSRVCIQIWDPLTLAAGSVVKYQVTAVHNEERPRS